MEEERVVPGRLGGDLWRRVAALLAADPLEGVRREDDRRRPRGELAVPVLPRCNKRQMQKVSFRGRLSGRISSNEWFVHKEVTGNVLQM